LSARINLRGVISNLRFAGNGMVNLPLELAKLSAVAWLGRRYATSRWIKGAIVTLVVTLMSLNAIGCYGFLAKAATPMPMTGQKLPAKMAVRPTTEKKAKVAG
jgi:hypothetical protein